MTELYQTQRAMRNMRRAAMQRGVIGILDIGTSKIACLVLKFDGSGVSREEDGVGPMAGQANFRVIGAATTRSRGMRYGETKTISVRTARIELQKCLSMQSSRNKASWRPRSEKMTGPNCARLRTE